MIAQPILCKDILQKAYAAVKEVADILPASKV